MPSALALPVRLHAHTLPPHYFLTPAHTHTNNHYRASLPSSTRRTTKPTTNHKHQAKAMKLVYTVAAVLFAAAPARAGISLSVTATDTTVKDLSTLNLEGAVETVLADDICVGGVYNYNAAVAKPEEIYIKKAFDVKLGDLALDARYRLPSQVAALTATLTRAGDYLKASINSADLLERVEASKSFTLGGDRKLSLIPAWDSSTKNFELKVAQDIQAGKTNAVLELSGADKDGKLTLNHQVDDANTISPTLSIKRGYLTYKWTHLLGDGAQLESTLDPFENLDVTWTDTGKGGAWVTRAQIPLKEPKTAQLSFKRKFTFQ